MSQATLEIIYQDQNIFIVNKPFNLHSISHSKNDSSLAALLAEQHPITHEINNIKGESGLLQRLDNMTSGCVLGALTQIAWEKLKLDIKANKINKTYLAIVENYPQKLFIDAAIGSPYRRAKKVRVYTDKLPKRALPASTQIEVLAKLNDNITLVRCITASGRRHQIRAHMAALGAPLLGDKLYGATLDVKDFFKQAYTLTSNLPDFILHAESLNFEHPISAKQESIFAPVPSYIVFP